MIAFATPLALLLFIPWGFAAWRLLRRARRQASPFPGLSLVPRVVTWRQRLGVGLSGLAGGPLATGQTIGRRLKRSLSRRVSRRRTGRMPRLAGRASAASHRDRWRRGLGRCWRR